ncbi:MAG: DUF6515 family protein [Ginsengibacter sp.]
MKRIIILVFIAVFSAGFFESAQAQIRGNAGIGRENSQPGISQPREERRPQRTLENPTRAERINSSNNSSVRMETRNNNRVSSVEKNNTSVVGNSPVNNRLVTTNNNSVSNSDRQNTLSRNRDIRNRVEGNQSVAIESNNSTTRVIPRSPRSVDQQVRYDRNAGRGNNNYTTNSYRRNNYNSNYYYRSGYNRRIYVMGGPRYNYRPYNSISINFGGSPYYYSDGLFYDYYSGYYQPIYPPFGIRISTLPFGYSRIYVGSNPFYYFNGTFYSQYENNYEVVDAPMGATVSSLPRGAKSVVINGEKFYELNGTYFKEDRSSKGKVIYIVVGKNGEINNSSDETGSLDAPQSLLQNGSIVAQLPVGSKIITLNGEKLYVAPDDTYLKEEFNGDIIQYRVVSK